MTFVRSLLLVSAMLGSAAVAAQELNTRFSCSRELGKDDDRVIYADVGEIRMVGDKIDTFRWESALHRSTHGFDCSIDESDGLLVEVSTRQRNVTWRVALADARAARGRRGFDFDRGMNCTIRLERDGDRLHVSPACPALCGSRANFSALSVNLKTGQCRYEE